MTPETSRRRLLGGFAAAVSVSLGAGCLSDPPELRVRNFSGTVRAIRVEITTDAGEILLDSKYELAQNEQATEDEVYDNAGTYTIAATVDGETTSNEVTLDEHDVITHVTVRDDGINIGRIAP